MKKILAIESSCDETAAAVVADGRQVLSSVVSTQIAEHIKYGGVVPEIASRRHTENIIGVTRGALEQAGCSLFDLDAIAVTAWPGLIGALLVGVNFAKGLSCASGVPLIPVHHLRGHIAANYITSPELEPPFLCLVVSGGHTHIVEVSGYTSFKVLGHTRDDAAGECFDKTARAMGLDYPGGVNLDKIAVNGDASRYIKLLPKPHLDTPLDMSFSGLKTAVVNLIHNSAQRDEEIIVPDLAAAVRRRVCDILCEKTMTAAEGAGYKKIALAGGVSANSELRSRMSGLCKKAGIELYMPKLSLCGDNAAMIGAQGYYEFLEGNFASADLNACATKDIV